MDMLPPGSVFVSTVVVITDTLEAHIDDIDASAIGDNSRCIRCAGLRQGQDLLGDCATRCTGRNAGLSAGNTVRVLMAHQCRSFTVVNYGFRAIAPRDDFTALDAVIPQPAHGL